MKNKNINYIKKNKSSNKFIQVNTKTKSILKNYDLNKVTYIQKCFKKFLTNKDIIANKNNLAINLIQKIQKTFLSKYFISFKKHSQKILTQKKKKSSKKRILAINTNTCNTNKISVNNTENSRIKENLPSFCRTTKHNHIMDYVNYKLNLNQANNNLNSTNDNLNDLNSIKITLPFSPKMNSVTNRQGFEFHKIKFKNSVKDIRNKNPRSSKILDKFKYQSKTLINNDFSNDLTVNNNMTEKNITLNMKNNEKSNKVNNYLLNISKISRMHKKGLSYNFDLHEANIKEAPTFSKEINPINSIFKNKKPKNNRNKPVQMNSEMNKIKKINTLFNTNNTGKKTKFTNSKIYENCLNKDAKDKNNIASKMPKTLAIQKKQKTKKELNTKKIIKKNKPKIKNNNLMPLNELDIKKRYFEFWKESTKKKNILIKFVKFSKYLNNMNCYEKIILIKDTIQKLIKSQKKEDINEFFWRIKRKIVINFMKKLKEFKIINKDLKIIGFKSKEKEKFDKNIKLLKILFKFFQKHKDNFNNNNSFSLTNYFEKWKNLTFNYPKISEKIIPLKTFQPKMTGENTPVKTNSDNIPLEKNISPNKISPKIINVINVQNYNENNNYNYNFKYEHDKDILLYPIKPRHSYNYSKDNFINNNKNIYHKKKLRNTYINNNYNFNFNSSSGTMMNCFNKKFIIEDKQKFDTYDNSSLMIPVQNNNSEIISFEKNNIFYNDEHPEEKFGFKKLEQIEEKEINFLENNNDINSKNADNNIDNNNNNKLYIKKNNYDKKHIFFKNKTSNVKAIKNTIKSLNIQFDNKNGEIIKKEKNNIFDEQLRMNDIFSAKNFFTEMNYYENQNDEDKNKKLLKLDVNTNFNDDY